MSFTVGRVNEPLYTAVFRGHLTVAFGGLHVYCLVLLHGMRCIRGAWSITPVNVSYYLDFIVLWSAYCVLWSQLSQDAYLNAQIRSNDYVHLIWLAWLYSREHSAVYGATWGGGWVRNGRSPPVNRPYPNLHPRGNSNHSSSLVLHLACQAPLTSNLSKTMSL